MPAFTSAEAALLANDPEVECDRPVEGCELQNPSASGLDVPSTSRPASQTAANHQRSAERHLPPISVHGIVIAIGVRLLEALQCTST